MYYKMAVELEPENGSNYFQIFRVHSRARQFPDALNAITTALELDPSNGKYRVEKAKLLKSLGQCDRAVLEYSEITDQDVATLLEEAKECERAIAAAQEAMAQQDYRLASQLYSHVMRHVEQASDLLFAKCTALYHNGDYYGVISDTGKILKVHPKHLEAYELRGNAYLRLGEHDLAIQHYREALKFDPEHSGCKKGHKLVKSMEKKKKKADEAFAGRNFEDAINKYWEAINIDTTHRVFARTVMLKIIQAYSRLGQHDEAVKQAELLVEEGGAAEQEWALGEALIDAERFEEAIRVFQRAAENLPEGSEESQKTNQKIKEAQVALKQSKEKNYYKILGVSRTATTKEIKSAYRCVSFQFGRTL
jgi:DnaJ family protein C protein 3